jgi:hypothetical protein
MNKKRKYKSETSKKEGKLTKIKAKGSVTSKINVAMWYNTMGGGRKYLLGWEVRGGGIRNRYTDI